MGLRRFPDRTLKCHLAASNHLLMDRKGDMSKRKNYGT